MGPLISSLIQALALLVTVSRLAAELTAISGLQCYICESTSFVSYTDAEAECNRGNLRKCPDTKHSACMIEAFKRDSPVYHVIKTCRNDCPVLINSTAQHVRCCFKDACNDVITIGSTTSDVSSETEVKQPTRNSLPAEQSPDVHESTTSLTTTKLDVQYELDSRVEQPGFEQGSRQRPTTTPMTRRRWPHARGRYPPSFRNRYGRRPPYHSAGHRINPTLTILIVTISVLTAVQVASLRLIQI